MSRPATIKTAEFNKERDIVIWHLEFLDDDKEQTYCYARPEYLEQVCNIAKSQHKEVTDEMLFDHCSAMIGKKINFAASGSIPEPIIDKKKAKEVQEDIEEMNKDANEFCSKVIEAAMDITCENPWDKDGQDS